MHKIVSSSLEAFGHGFSGISLTNVTTKSGTTESVALKKRVISTHACSRTHVLSHGCIPNQPPMHTKPRNLVAGHPGYPQDARNQGLSPSRSRKDTEEVRDIRELSGEAHMCAIPAHLRRSLDLLTSTIVDQQLLQEQAAKRAEAMVEMLSAAS